MRQPEGFQKRPANESDDGLRDSLSAVEAGIADHVESLNIGRR